MGLEIWYDPAHHDHDPGESSPERPSRVVAVTEALASAGLPALPKICAEASDDELELVHLPRYLGMLEQLSARGGGDLHPDTPVGPRSLQTARRAARMCIEAAQSVIQHAHPVMCLTRPPGHHAGRDEGMGFCLINSASVAAEWALRYGGAERVAVVDFDVHHGNGTQDIFWTSPEVLYVSLHQWPWYPWIRGSLGEVGEGPGEGATVNIPLPAMTGDEVYLEAFGRIVVPVIEQFAPDLLIVSAGFDAHEEDPLSLQGVSSEGFGLIGGQLSLAAQGVCGGRLMAVLEGGYNLPALAASASAFASALTGGPRVIHPEALSDSLPYSEHALSKVLEFHGRRWKLG